MAPSPACRASCPNRADRRERGAIAASQNTTIGVEEGVEEDEEDDEEEGSDGLRVAYLSVASCTSCVTKKARGAAQREMLTLDARVPRRVRHSNERHPTPDLGFRVQARHQLRSSEEAKRSKEAKQRRSEGASDAKKRSEAKRTFPEKRSEEAKQRSEAAKERRS